jgi:hypothetical protein
VLGRSGRFVITPKGNLQSVDRLSTFRLHLGWAALLVVALALSFQSDRPQTTMRLWSGMLVMVCLTPLLISLGQRIRLRRSERLDTARVVRRIGPADAASSAYYQGAEL